MSLPDGYHKATIVGVDQYPSRMDGLPIVRIDLVVRRRHLVDEVRHYLPLMSRDDGGPNSYTAHMLAQYLFAAWPGRAHPPLPLHLWPIEDIRAWLIARRVLVTTRYEGPTKYTPIETHRVVNVQPLPRRLARFDASDT